MRTQYQKIINLLGNANNHASKFRTKAWVGVNDDARRIYNTNSLIKFKTTMLKSSLCDCNDVCILVKGTITITKAGADAAIKIVDERNK